MVKCRIKLGSAEAANKFVSEITPLASEFDISCGKGAIDAKSIIGVLCLDMSSPLELNCVIADGEKEKVEKILAKYKA